MVNGDNQRQIRILILKENQNKIDQLFRVKKGWTIQIVLSSCLTWRNVRFFTNIPNNENDLFQRNKYQELQWISPSRFKYDHSNRYVSILCSISGTFHYYFTIDGTALKEKASGEGYFQIERNFHFSNDENETFSQDSIVCQTVLSKLLGPTSEWLSRLEVTYHSGYNLIHFTPIQKLNSTSNSSYSINDHHQINPSFNGSFQQIKEIVDFMERKWKILSITDLVYNHAATDCQFIKDHPEVTYNLVNCPYLKAAVLLDSILIQFTIDASQGKLLSKGISDEIKENNFHLIKNYLLNDQIKKYRLEEFYICDVNLLINEFRQQLNQLNKCSQQRLNHNENLLVLQHGNYERMKTRVDLKLAQDLFYYQRDSSKTNEQLIDMACQQLFQHLSFLNKSFQDKLFENLNRAIDNCISSCRYYFLSYDGPKFKKFSFPSTPFVSNYFYYPNGEFKHPDEINQLIESDVHYQTNVMALNGWIMNNDSFKSFADQEDVYLCRDLIQWTDLIKFRFGSNRDDCPILYSYLKEYTRLVATIFHGCRLDNCHSTPLWFLQEMMDYARQLNKEFYINAELFTNNIETDIHFINRIGINSLVRESCRAFDPYGLGEMCLSLSNGNGICSFIQSNVHPFTSDKIFSLFYDQTHDNPCQIEKRSVEDLLPRSAIVSMTISSIGSVRGYDELVPHSIDLVHETRFYPKWGYHVQQTNEKTCLISLKRALNQLHIDLAQQGFHELTMEKLSTSALLIKRHNPQSHKSVYLISHTSFYQSSDKWEYISPLSIEGVIDEIILEGTIHHPQNREPVKNFQKSNKIINGLEQTKIYLKENLMVEESRCVRLTSPNSPDYTGYRTIEFTDEFRPGSIVILQVSLLPQIRQTVIDLRQLLNEFSNRTSSFHRIVNELTLIDLERVLYRTSIEEQTDGKGFDVYVIPEYGQLIYCGIQGQMSVLENIRLNNQTQHPLVLNLKQGNWLMDYIANRLKINSNTKKLGEWFSKAFRYIGDLPRPMIPVYFDLIITGSYSILLERGWSLMTPFIRESSTFVRALSQTSIQLLSFVSNARLPLLSSSLKQPRPIEQIDEQTFERTQQLPSLAAGFPYFSGGIWRNWGRDTFISLRGLLLITGRYEEARYLILSYASCLRHGLIPNLLADGKYARYNARDAVWWWFYSISNYISFVNDGHQIFRDKISRLYPTDDSSPKLNNLNDYLLHDVIHEILCIHYQSLTFRERGAGYSLDPYMNDQGFNNQIGIDHKTGFVYGGNRWNCGTWMDKMGSSEKASNKGHPATPRDGSPIELVALCRATLSWLIEMNKNGFYPYDFVQFQDERSNQSKTLLIDWLKKIDENFEKEFWIDENNSHRFVNRKQIYKDTVNSSLQWTDFQFRPNFLLAAVIAPEMFDKTHIWLSLKSVENVLLGKYGIKSLDPNDQNYVADYNNDEDSTDYKRAQGFNYHNGPEWLWLTGYYIRAKLYWAKKLNDALVFDETIEHIQQIISLHIDLIFSNDWKGLPELTNANGKPCSFSCQVHAAASASFLEALYDLSQT